MKKSYGVYLGILAFGLASLTGPSLRAGDETDVAAPAASSPDPATTAVSAATATDLNSRIAALKEELASLESEKAKEDAGAAVDQAPAQSAPTTQAVEVAPAPTPLPSPSMTMPLSTAAPAHTFDAGPFKTLAVTGILSGVGVAQNHWLSDGKGSVDVGNAQVFLQKTTGWFQFYLQGGVYNLLTVGYPFATTNNNAVAYGPLPLGYVKLVKGNFNVEIGKLPTLIGGEYTFSFENMNVERGLLWFQETAISRGIQVSDSYKKLSASISWNDGFYSNRFNWISGSLALALNASNTISFVAGGNAGKTNYGTAATPFLQNNGQIYNLLYTYSHEALMITPYFQYTRVPVNQALGILNTGNTSGGAILMNYNFKHGVSLAVRPEYITEVGGTKSLDLLGCGAGCNAFSLTFTPAYQKGGYFLRGDLSVVHLRSFTNGFSSTGTEASQVRAVIETGFLF
jgi:uncharacterized small protein (DUF1192 family)